ncbi:MAG TPA: nicotinate-nucleotide adenylyltransferase [Dehalococcoidia bacterium]|nr:nicotinate-nucleotide adenylyltransferase [Dehalococcoidia bacterium]
MAELKLGILGGTFDPVHLGHLLMADVAQEEFSLDRVIFMPAGLPWRKTEREITPAKHRLNMLDLALQGTGFRVSTAEMEREGPSYTVDTLEQLATEYPGAALFFILGYDALLDMPNWKSPERIVQLATLVVALRRHGDELHNRDLARVLQDGRLHKLAMPIIEISSSDIRERVASGRSIRFRVPPGVEEYIRRNNLYQRPTGGK